MAKKRKKRRSLIGTLLDALLSAVDWICETVSALVVGAMKGLLRGVWLALRLLCRGALLFVRGALAVPAWLFERLTAGGDLAARCLKLDGPEFEAYVALVLADNGFKNVELTKGSGDQGADVLAERNGKTYAIQCKNYQGAVGNFAVQEAYAAKEYYGCDAAAVICPGEFTRGAKELARSTGVLLWGGERLSHMMRVSGRRPKRAKNP